jgi:hypothetical protein
MVKVKITNDTIQMGYLAFWVRVEVLWQDWMT